MAASVCVCVCVEGGAHPPLPTTFPTFEWLFSYELQSEKTSQNEILRRVGWAVRRTLVLFCHVSAYFLRKNSKKSLSKTVNGAADGSDGFLWYCSGVKCCFLLIFFGENLSARIKSVWSMFQTFNSSQFISYRYRLQNKFSPNKWWWWLIFWRALGSPRVAFSAAWLGYFCKKRLSPECRGQL